MTTGADLDALAEAVGDLHGHGRSTSSAAEGVRSALAAVSSAAGLPLAAGAASEGGRTVGSALTTLSSLLEALGTDARKVRASLVRADGR
ncbi:MAG: hypothetical protein JWM64_509 [Frankiales bacterium]|nr:hypothetical protein [Frankiales bacterium]